MEYDTGSGVSALLGGGFVLIFGQIFSIRGKELSKTNLEALNSTKSQKASLPVEVRRAMLVSQNNETAAMLVSQTTAVEVELFSYANAVFCSKKFA